MSDETQQTATERRISRRYSKRRTDFALIYIGATIWGILGAMAADSFQQDAGVTILLGLITAGVGLLGGYQAIGAFDFRTATLTARKGAKEE